MKKSIIILLLFSLLAVGNLYAQNGKPGTRNPEKHQRLMTQLNLTDSQEDQFNQIRNDHQKQAIDLRAELKKNQLEIRSMMESGKVDAGKLRSMTSKSSDIRAQLQNSRIDMWLNIYNLLNDDQKEVWTDHFSTMGPDSFRGRKGGRDFDRPMRGMREGRRN